MECWASRSEKKANRFDVQCFDYILISWNYWLFSTRRVNESLGVAQNLQINDEIALTTIDFGFADLISSFFWLNWIGEYFLHMKIASLFDERKQTCSVCACVCSNENRFVRLFT